MKVKWITFFMVILFLLNTNVASAERKKLANLIQKIHSTPSPTGYEQPMVKMIQNILKNQGQQSQDNLGNFYLTLGRGESILAILTGLDEVGYIVSGITDDGLINLDRVVPAPSSIFDSQHFGHPMKILTSQGAVTGVLVLPSLHIYPRTKRKDLPKLFTLDYAFLDIGATSKMEVKSRGIELLNPVTPIAEINELTGRKRAGYYLGTKSCIALLIDVVRKINAKKLKTRSTFAWITQTQFPVRRSRPVRSMGALRVNNTLSVNQVLIIGVLPCDEEQNKTVIFGNGPVLTGFRSKKSPLKEQILKVAGRHKFDLQILDHIESSVASPFLEKDKDVVGLFLPVKFFSTPSEVVLLEDIYTLQRLVYRSIVEVSNEK
jgi:putative aminopeptidase FrvX